MIYKNYILPGQLHKKIGKSKAVLYANRTAQFIRVYDKLYLDKNSISQYYQELVKQCNDLGDYFYLHHIRQDLDLSSYAALKLLPYVVEDGFKFVKIPDDLKQKLKQGKTIFRIKNEEDLSLADEVLDFYSIKIGVY